MFRLIVILLGLLPATLAAETPPEKGLTIAREADRRDNGFGDFTARMEMILRNRQGEESTRRLRISTLEVKGDGDKGLSVFDEPADVKGTALLTFTHKAGEDDQWLYLPALKRVKRIASANKSGPFMGSEFAYEDVASQEIEMRNRRVLSSPWRLRRIISICAVKAPKLSSRRSASRAMASPFSCGVSACSPGTVNSSHPNSIHFFIFYLPPVSSAAVATSNSRRRARARW